METQLHWKNGKSVKNLLVEENEDIDAPKLKVGNVDLITE
jgi:hypothetical protein